MVIWRKVCEFIFMSATWSLCNPHSFGGGKILASSPKCIPIVIYYYIVFVGIAARCRGLRDSGALAGVGQLPLLAVLDGGTQSQRLRHHGGPVPHLEGRRGARITHCRPGSG